MAKRIGAAAVVFDEAGRVLLVRHSYGKQNWELPGGGSVAGRIISLLEVIPLG